VTVLSTPSHDDGTLALDALVTRVASGAVNSCTPHDLALALFRLRPHSDVTPDMSGLHLPIELDAWSQHVGGKPVEPPDGMELVRSWIEAGGLSPYSTAYRFEESPSPTPGWHWAPEHPPYPAEVLDRLRIDHAMLLGTATFPDAAALAPGWPDLGTTGANSGMNYSAALLGASGPLGTPSHANFLTLMTGDTEERTRAATYLLELVATDRLSEPHLREAAGVLNRAGRLPLTRFAQVVEQAFASGGLADLWGPALGVAEDASTRQPRPSGLPELLRVLTAYAPAVPDPTLPDGLTRLATSRGTSKSHAEARALALACGLTQERRT
jgi:hypothetical protein